MKLALAVLMAVVACGGTDSTGPTTSTLQNDDYSSGSPSFVAGFVTGEAAAVRFTAKSAGYTIQHVQFLFGGSAVSKTITLTIYPDNGTLVPGTPIYSHDYPLTGSDNSMQDIDLTSANVQVDANQQIRVAIIFQHDGLPSVAKDASITNGKNLILASGVGWVTAESAGINGDFIIRAQILTP